MPECPDDLEARAQKLTAVGAHVLEMAKRRGVTEADAVASYSTDFEVKVANNKIINLTQATAKGLGVRVFVGKQLGFATTSDFRPASLQALVERAVALAKESAADPFNGLPEKHDDAGEGVITPNPFDTYDPNVMQVDVHEKIRWAHALEEAARSVDPRVQKFQDSGVSSGDGTTVLVTSSGISSTQHATGISAWCNPIASCDGELQEEHWYDTKTHVADLTPLAEIGKIAATRAVRMLGAKSVSTQRVPVIFEPVMAAGLVASIVGALDGDLIFKKASFLTDKLGQRVATRQLSLVDDPHLQRKAGSARVDSEGMPTYKKRLIDKGVLTTFLYDTYTSRKAQQKPTASSRRGYSTLPHAGVFNLVVEPGTDDVAEIWRDVPRALIVTRGLGRGLNTVSGEYSRGMNGLWLERGEIVHPVQEVTIAGDYLAILEGIDRVGSDFFMRGGVGAPTVRVAEMVVSGRM